MIVFVEKTHTLSLYINHLHFSITPIVPSHFSLLFLPRNYYVQKHTHKPYTNISTTTKKQKTNPFIIFLIFMHANLKPFSLMGLPNKIEKDLHVATKREVYSNCLQDTEETLLEAALKIRVPPRGGVDGGDDGGCSTPKAEDRGGEVVLPKCPPPPRKPKSAPLQQKRKAKRVLLDLSSEIESMFPSNILRDFMCGKIKKIRTEIL